MTIAQHGEDLAKLGKTGQGAIVLPSFTVPSYHLNGSARNGGKPGPGRVFQVVHAKSMAIGNITPAVPSTLQSASVPKATLTPQHSNSEFLASFYEPLCDLGSGSFSTVRLARERCTAHKRVCKDVRMSQMAPEAVEFTKQEMQVLAELDHPNVVKLFEFAEDLGRQQLLLVLEYIPGGDCSELLQNGRAAGRCLSEALVVDLIRQLLVAMSYCHSRHIIHRDIKPENMMLIRRNSDALCCKVIDFGLACPQPRSRAFVGTPAYMSPEMVVGDVDYTSLTDIWSVGVTTIELLAGLLPFGRPEDYGSMDPLFNKIQSFRGLEDAEEMLTRSQEWRGRSLPSRDFIRWLMQPLPIRRPQAAQALAHEWIEANSESSPSDGLSSGMIGSMVAFAAASPLVRACLVVIAARRGAYGQEMEISKAFTDADVDCDGFLSKEELREALTSGPVCWKVSNTQMRQMLKSIEAHQSSGLSFTEFTAACLYHHFESEDAIAMESFGALDHDRDHQVLLSDIHQLFPATVQPCLEVLPKDRPFSCLEWRKCVASTKPGEKQRGSLTTPTSVGFRSTDPFSHWLQRFFLCDGCDSRDRESRDDDESTLNPCARRYDACREVVADEDSMHCAVGQEYDPCSEASPGDEFMVNQSPDFYTPRVEVKEQIL